MAQALGADLSGEPDGMHIEPVDPRSKNQAAVMLLYPYGIVVGRDGRRFFDEGAGLVHETWEAFSRRLHFEVPGRTAYAVLDARVRAISDWQRATRSEVPPFEAATLAELAKQIGVDADNLAATVAAYNAACTGNPQKFDATICDGLAASASLAPPKSNWARAIAEPPFLAWPMIGAIAYTFGGLATDVSARVLGGGAPIPGLTAAGEITGHFYGTCRTRCRCCARSCWPDRWAEAVASLVVLDLRCWLPGTSRRHPTARYAAPPARPCQVQRRAPSCTTR